MSNKPKIYANCKAGCLWETVHKDDFQRSAAFIKQNVIDSHGINEFYVEKGQTCIFTRENPQTFDWGTYAVVESRQGDELGRIEFSRTAWDTSIRFKYCEVAKASDGTSYSLYYEKNGANGGQLQLDGLPTSEIVIRVVDFDEVYLVNDAMYAVVDAEEVSV